VPATRCNIARITGSTPARLDASELRLATAVHIVVRVSLVVVVAFAAIELVAKPIVDRKMIITIPAIDDILAVFDFQNDVIARPTVEDVIA
jgi:hypothetical protein